MHPIEQPKTIRSRLHGSSNLGSCQDADIAKLSFGELCEMFNYTPKFRPIDTAEFANFIQSSVDTVEGYRYRRVGPRYFSPEGTRRVWYAERDVLEWLASGMRRSTSDQPADVAAA